jgi:hypothetical protein
MSEFLLVLHAYVLNINLQMSMSSSSNGTSSPCKSKVVCEVVGLRFARCVCNLPLKR